MRLPALVAVLSLASCLVPSAHAAESYDNCTNTITSLPTVISSQGVWCMKSDLSSSLASGSVISVQTNNVTIDCNGFKLGGLGAGAGTAANGIRADSRLNVRIRNCQIRGFAYGLILTGGAGHLVEGNRFDGNRTTSIYVSADASMIRGNVIVDTGGAEPGQVASGIFVGGRTHVVDNTIDGTVPSGTNIPAYGIWVNDPTSIVGNRIGGIVHSGTAVSRGIFVNGSHVLIKDNFIDGGDVANSMGVACANETTIARDNSVVDAVDGVNGCYSLDNVFMP